MKKDFFEATLSKTKERDKKNQLEEGIDYYFDNGLMVFTSHFLLKRGYCCDNGCRHCPYFKDEFQVSSSKFQEME